MTESGKTVHILFLNGQKRTFTNVAIDTTTEGWLYVTRLELQEAPISGVVEPIAGYRLDALAGWEYAEAEQQMQAQVNWFENQKSGEH
jgi:hypothetical protein